MSRNDSGMREGKTRGLNKPGHATVPTARSFVVYLCMDTEPVIPKALNQKNMMKIVWCVCRSL